MKNNDTLKLITPPKSHETIRVKWVYKGKKKASRMVKKKIQSITCCKRLQVCISTSK